MPRVNANDRLGDARAIAGGPAPAALATPRRQQVDSPAAQPWPHRPADSRHDPYRPIAQSKKHLHEQPRQGAQGSVHPEPEQRAQRNAMPSPLVAPDEPPHNRQRRDGRQRHRDDLDRPIAQVEANPPQDPRHQLPLAGEPDHAKAKQKDDDPPRPRHRPQRQREQDQDPPDHVLEHEPEIRRQKTRTRSRLGGRSVASGIGWRGVPHDGLYRSGQLNRAVTGRQAACRSLAMDRSLTTGSALVIYNLNHEGTGHQLRFLVLRIFLSGHRCRVLSQRRLCRQLPSLGTNVLGLVSF